MKFCLRLLYQHALFLFKIQYLNQSKFVLSNLLIINFESFTFNGFSLDFLSFIFLFTFLVKISLHSFKSFFFIISLLETLFPNLIFLCFSSFIFSFFPFFYSFLKLFYWCIIFLVLQIRICLTILLYVLCFYPSLT